MKIITALLIAVVLVAFPRGAAAQISLFKDIAWTLNDDKQSKPGGMQTVEVTAMSPRTIERLLNSLKNQQGQISLLSGGGAASLEPPLPKTIPRSNARPQNR